MLTKINWLSHDFVFNLVNLLPASVFWKDKAGLYCGCNNSFAQVLGLKSVEEVLGKTDYDLATKDLGDHYLKDDREVMESGIPKLNIEEEQNFPDGRKVFILTNKVPIFNKDKEVVGVLGIFNDITELKKAKLAAESANKAKTAFLANMSHDIRTPLTSIMGLADLLAKQLQTSEEISDINLIYQAAEQLLALLNSILDVASMEHANEDELKKESFSLFDFAKSLEGLFLPAIKLKGLSFHLAIDEAISETVVISDRTKLQRVLLNLITNAIKFTNKGRVCLGIKLVSKSDSDTIQVEFRVSDTGLGISAEKLPYVFDQFFRVSPMHKESGYGVGLYIVKRFVSLLGGNIQVDSKLGEGTIFFFSLLMPLAKREIQKKNIASTEMFKEKDKKFEKKGTAMKLAHQVSESTVNPDLNLHKKEKLVLFVEDNPMALKVGEIMLEDAGYKLHIATNAVDAFKLAKAYPFDLIITDIGLPEISGDEFVSLYRRFEQKQNKTPIFIIALTAQFSKQCEQEYLAVGINEVWTKPLTEQKLKELAHYFDPKAKHLPSA
jgi:two-component system, OmpR family, aerobic respiration control sensor histidine kinase ArcB